MGEIVTKIVPRIEKAEKDGDWELVLSLLQKAEFMARAKYYEHKTIEIEARIDSQQNR